MPRGFQFFLPCLSMIEIARFIERFSSLIRYFLFIFFFLFSPLLPSFFLSFTTLEPLRGWFRFFFFIFSPILFFALPRPIFSLFRFCFSSFCFSYHSSLPSPAFIFFRQYVLHQIFIIADTILLLSLLLYRHARYAPSAAIVEVSLHTATVFTLDDIKGHWDSQSIASLHFLLSEGMAFLHFNRKYSSFHFLIILIFLHFLIQIIAFRLIDMAFFKIFLW